MAGGFYQSNYAQFRLLKLELVYRKREVSNSHPARRKDFLHAQVLEKLAM